MVIFVFTKQAHSSFLKLSKEVQQRVINKLKILKKHDDVLSVFKQLRDFEPATHRLRIGNYRLILQLRHRKENEFEFWILDVGHRKDIYK